MSPPHRTEGALVAKLAIIIISIITDEGEIKLLHSSNVFKANTVLTAVSPMFQVCKSAFSPSLFCDVERQNQF